MAEGSVTLLSDLDFQVRCARKAASQGADPIAAKKEVEQVSAQSFEAEVKLSAYLTASATLPWYGGQGGTPEPSPPSRAFDTNFYPGDFGNAGAFGKQLDASGNFDSGADYLLLKCGNDHAEHQRMAFALYYISEGAAASAHVTGTSWSTHRSAVSAMLASVRAAASATSGVDGLTPASEALLTELGVLAGQLLDDSDLKTLAQLKGHSSTTTPTKAEVMQRAAERDDLFFKMLGRAAERASSWASSSSSSQSKEAAERDFCLLISKSLMVANEAYVMKVSAPCSHAFRLPPPPPRTAPLHACC